MKVTMRMRIGMGIGLAVGYYLGARAGREQYERINQILRQARQSDAVDAATGKAKAVVDLGMERAKDLSGHKLGNGAASDPD
jgi:hypothetical protein